MISRAGFMDMGFLLLHKTLPLFSYPPVALFLIFKQRNPHSYFVLGPTKLYSSFVMLVWYDAIPSPRWWVQGWVPNWSFVSHEAFLGIWNLGARNLGTSLRPDLNNGRSTGDLQTSAELVLLFIFFRASLLHYTLCLVKVTITFYWTPFFL